MRKRLVTLVLAVSMAIGAVGCAKNNKTDEGTNAGGTADKKVKITLWHSFVGADQRAKFMEDRMNEFRAKYPNYEIDEQKMPRDQYQTKLKTQAAAGQLPDAFLLWPNAMTKEFAEANLLADINDILDNDPEWKNSLNPRALDEFTVNGKTYSAGLGITTTSMIFYNKAIFDKYGVSFPQSYDELKEAIKTFSKNGIIPIALGNKALWPVQSTIFSLLANRNTGSEWLDNVLAKNGAQFTDPQFIDSLNKLKELTDLGAFNKDYNSIDDVQMRDYFYKGQAAMVISGSWIVPDMIEKASEEVKKNIEIGILPAIPGGKGDPNVMTGVSSTGIVINAKATPEQKEAIGNLIKFLTNSDSQVALTKYNIPVSSKTVTLDEATADPIYAKMIDLISKHPLVTVYDSALNSEQADIINNGLQAVMIGQQTPEDLAKKLQAAVK
ncbi:ABC transporter substrate-binding protein [Clostridium thermarum]|uniref:ABC transporter substrate-binding protein n=1 Tax=Clostridium thermarum TaxID=1716543 RepID=UPI0013D3568F|nr:extracellular solute-binding protein [Clostridium thermarum]